MFNKSLLFLTIFILVGCQKPESDKQSDGVVTTSIEVKTVKCEMCVDNITKALEAVEGVTKANVDLKKKVASVQYLPSKLALAVLEHTIAEAGYDANETKRNEEVYRTLPKCCQ
ncbi:MAG: heavy-metal-associated domain-containing protein [Bacteroidetes bacterium]|nr:heavy-metal-associated domain-containing protein [Bacteroidota bacterium]MCW5894392.1 heavy-metal-associated domain-containing protein [Bacteroidota bacterium]